MCLFLYFAPSKKPFCNGQALLGLGRNRGALGTAALAANLVGSIIIVAQGVLALLLAAPAASPIETRELVELAHLPGAQEPDEDEGGEVHEADEELGAAVGAAADLEDNDLGKGGGQDEDDPGQGQGRGKQLQAHDLGQDGGRRRPDDARAGARQQGKDDAGGQGKRKDPEHQAQHADKGRAEPGHVEAADGVAGHANDGSA
jgi:hypothetical protein